MKRTLSAILSAAMLTAALTGTTLAVDKSALPALALDEPQSFTFEPTAKENQDRGDAYATFTPAQDGYYQFVCDTPYTGTPVASPTDTSSENENTLASWSAIVYEEEGESYSAQGMNLGFDLSSSSLMEEEKNQILELFPHPEKVAVYANLYAGTAYVFRFSNESATPYTSNLTVSTHEHEYGETVTEKSGVTNEGTTFGGVYRACTVCGYLDYSEIYPQVDECILKTEQYVYDGKAKKPAVTVTTLDDKKLDASQYSVSYKNNKKVGKATVTIKFKGNYKGTVTKSFKIVPKGTSLTKAAAKKKAVALKWKKQGEQTSGYEIQYSTKSNFNGAKTVTVKKKNTTSKTIKNLKPKKKYYFRIRTYKTVSGKKYYSSWSGKKSVKVK